MTSRMARILAVFVVLIFVASASLPGGNPTPIPARQFEFTYKVTVPAQAAGGSPLRLWIPLPPGDGFQEIADLKIASPVPYKVQKESEYGNRIAYFEVSPEQAKSPFDVVLNFRVTRREHRVSLAAFHPSSSPTAHAELARYVHPDRKVPLDGVIGEIAKQQLGDLKDPLAKARKAYEYVIANMKYDKSGEGWGRGDAIWACTAKRGNCTDFHALFIGLLRASGVPAKFEIGFPLPEDKNAGDIPGYHCWAQFYLDGVGWVPVDASEAWKHPEKHDYFFGAHDDNRVLFSYGRDLRLNPAQQGDPLNYFIYPYAEAQGKPVEKLQTHFEFRDVAAHVAAGN